MQYRYCLLLQSLVKIAVSTFRLFQNNIDSGNRLMTLFVIKKCLLLYLANF